MKHKESFSTSILKPFTAFLDVLNAPVEKPQKTLAKKIFIRKHSTINPQIYISVKPI